MSRRKPRSMDGSGGALLPEGTSPAGADLHLHTTFSDGTWTPEALVAAARERHLAVIAVTDHDTLEGLEPARRAAGAEGPEVVAGVEFGTPHDEADAEEMHIVGLFLNTSHTELLERLVHSAADRRQRVLAMVEKLNRAGVRIRPEDVFGPAGPGTVSRLHTARALVKAGCVTTVGQAFSQWLRRGKPGFVPSVHPPANETIALIHRAGGVAVMAHPGLTARDAEIPGLVEMGLDAIEVYCAEHTGAQVRRYAETAQRHGLLIGGGSDCHGANKDRLMLGEVRLDKPLVDALRQRAAQHAEMNRG